MEKNPMESQAPIISKCLDPECKKLYKCTLEDQDCKIKISGEDGKCTQYSDCLEKKTTKLSHGYCKTGCMQKALSTLPKGPTEEQS